MMNDTLGRANYCNEGHGYLSLFFNISDSNPNDFWDFVGQETFELDLTKVFNRTTSMGAIMMGYGGSDSEPTCDMTRCWYITILPTAMTIP